MKITKLSAVLLSAIVLVAVFAGCGKEISKREKTIKEYEKIIKKISAYSSVSTVKTVTVNYESDGNPATDTIVYSAEKHKDGGKITAAHILKSFAGDGGESYLDITYIEGNIYADFSGLNKLFSSVSENGIEKYLSMADPEFGIPDPNGFSDIGTDENSAELSVRYYIPSTEYLAEITGKYRTVFENYVPGGSINDLNGKVIYNKNSGLTVCNTNLTVSDVDGKYVNITCVEELTGKGDVIEVIAPDKSQYTEIPELLSVFDYRKCVESFGSTSSVNYNSTTSVTLSGKPDKKVTTKAVLSATTDSDGTVTFDFNETGRSENYNDFKPYELKYKYGGQSLEISVTDTADQTINITQNDARAFIAAHLKTTDLLDFEKITAIAVDSASGVKTISASAGNNTSEIINDSLEKLGFFGESAEITSYLPETAGKTTLDKNGNIIKTEYHIPFTFNYYEEEYTCTVDYIAELSNFEVQNIELYSDT